MVYGGVTLTKKSASTMINNNEQRCFILENAVIPLLQKKVGDYKFLTVSLFACFAFFQFGIGKDLDFDRVEFFSGRLWLGLLVGSVLAGVLYFRTSKLLSDAITERGLYKIIPLAPKFSEQGSQDYQLLDEINKRTLGGRIENTLNFMMLMSIIASAASFVLIALSTKG